MIETEPFNIREHATTIISTTDFNFVIAINELTPYRDKYVEVNPNSPYANINHVTNYLFNNGLHPIMVEYNQFKVSNAANLEYLLNVIPAINPYAIISYPEVSDTTKPINVQQDVTELSITTLPVVSVRPQRRCKGKKAGYAIGIVIAVVIAVVILFALYKLDVIF